ncbi:adenylate/guanylate cyclase domain-containing protein [Paraferrimonas sp. SM1919]|uniref:adenylate/guanylate cyclase domain-containing protein n=1 Tax=Paraferrimonas sp. SM1919 TaxID=2662263 RepID=UPI001969E8FD|nr:adenylate/guanylate cyclase domain-containing protein [Paraferrimonas sp. SM1919]
MSAFVTFRYSQSEQLPLWAANQSDLVVLSVYMGIVLGSLHWLSNIITDSSAIRRLPYTILVLLKAAFLLVGIAVIAFITQMVQMWALLNHVVTLHNFINFEQLSAPEFQSLILFIIVIRLAVAFIEQMVLLIGPRVLFNIAIGRYHKPSKEDRTFIFMNMIASTAHAESLGDYRFSRLIQDCFQVLADIVARHEGEIYRYIGDAVMISWPGYRAAKKQRVLKVFFEFQQELMWQEKYFKKHYGFVPQFKAAAHCGEVMAAVVGVDKQEISYFSDILNTLARLQDQCSPLQQQLLISGEVLNSLDQYGFENQKLFSVVSQGPLTLKGKKQQIQAYGIKLAEDQILTAD